MEFAEEVDRYRRACKHINARVTQPAAERLQQRVRDAYNSRPAQIVVALLIFANFSANAAQSEMLPAGDVSALYVHVAGDIDMYICIYT